MSRAKYLIAMCGNNAESSCVKLKGSHS